MSLLKFSGAPFDSTLVGSTNELIGEPSLGSFLNQEGSGKSKKKRSVKKSKSTGRKVKSVKKSTSTKKKTLKKRVVKRPTSKKVKKEIDKYTKVKLEKLSKKNGISIYRKDGSRKTKSQLFRTLKRKKLV
jgi:hypothetical protein